MTPEDIRLKLVNWAHFVRDYSPQDISQTGKILERMRKNAGNDGYAEPDKPRIIVDELEGWHVEQQLRKCMPTNKKLLVIIYVWRAPPVVACRKLRIPHNPPHIFELHRRNAEQEIGRVLESNPMEKRYNPRDNLNPRKASSATTGTLVAAKNEPASVE